MSSESCENVDGDSESMEYDENLELTDNSFSGDEEDEDEVVEMNEDEEFGVYSLQSLFI